MMEKRKPKGWRNITVGDHLYFWTHYGSDSDPNGHGVYLIDSVTRARRQVVWEDVVGDVLPPYPILPRHVANWIKTNL